MQSRVQLGLVLCGRAEVLLLLFVSRDAAVVLRRFVRALKSRWGWGRVIRSCSTKSRSMYLPSHRDSRRIISNSCGLNSFSPGFATLSRFRSGDMCCLPLNYFQSVLSCHWMCQRPESDNPNASQCQSIAG